MTTIQAKIKNTAFVSDNSESLQGGLRMDQLKALTGPEYLSQHRDGDIPTVVPLTFRCANHLLNLAWGDSKEAISYESQLLSTMYKCTASFPTGTAVAIGSKLHLVCPTRWMDEIHPLR
ncbi:hypothetical protein BLNAU_4947 [Blattamonas nauphoetae]|uniref:Uncharacterized protein n=1 Tax=Blattamonas nauphoetae TaxID=2049346 RepID=A0ABQ9Y8S3_9EUKA|nr:hypothetical protein BLNAU_4947 [Blattamonas nauphoetae]